MKPALAKAPSQATGTKLETNTLKAVAIFCGGGLLLSLALAIAYRIDLSPGLV